MADFLSGAILGDYASTLLATPRPDSYQFTQDSGNGADWRSIYIASFREDERVPEAKIIEDIADGKRLMHTTRQQSGSVLSFSIVRLLQGLSEGAPIQPYLSYLATDANARCNGIGSRHLQQLMRICREQFVESPGIFWAIEATQQAGLELHVREARKRRLRFYEKSGARQVCAGKVFPLKNYAGGAARQGEFIYLPFASAATAVEIRNALRVIYRQLYEYSEEATETILSEV